MTTGCARQTVWQVHNATGGPIAFRTKDSRTEIEPGGAAGIVIDGGSFDVISGGNDWFFVRPPFPASFIDAPVAPWQKRRGVLAVTPEGKIYLLRPETSELPDKAPPQPEGFPLSPFINGAGDRLTPEDFNNAIRK
jgi:hypothetical protein